MAYAIAVNDSRFSFRSLTFKQAAPGLILVAIGLLVLLSGTVVLRVIGGIFGVIVFSLLAAYAYVEGQRTGSRFWQFAALPLLALAVAAIFPGALGTLFTVAIAIGFFVLWLNDKTKWWALIPAVLFGFQGLVRVFKLSASAPVFYILVGIVLIVASQSTRTMPRWVGPAGIGVLILGAASLLFGATYAAPLLFIGVGIYVLLRNTRRI